MPTTLKADSPADKKSAKTGVLMRALTILETLMRFARPLSLGEIATATALDQSSVLRLLRVLESARYVLRTPTKMYLPSPKALRPMPLLHPLEQLRRNALPTINNLAQALNKTVSLVIFWGGERMVLEVAQTGNSLTPYYDYWLQGPLHGTGGGKAYLLSLPPEQRRLILGSEPYPSFTANTATTWAALNAQLELAQSRGFVVAQEDYHMGITALAANIKTWDGTVLGCLTVTGWVADFSDEQIVQIGEETKRAADLLLFRLTSIREVQQFGVFYRAGNSAINA